jgi:hypothetical protein
MRRDLFFRTLVGVPPLLVSTAIAAAAAFVFPTLCALAEDLANTVPVTRPRFVFCTSSLSEYRRDPVTLPAAEAVSLTPG